ncbi:hypothetical protein [Hyphomicrobium sulfonivorans]|uniref:hypothetical protein n=1 Tax=Hyphomicrobium sulfonivorans TaxID=121290 RepID=UPI00156E9C56|nr:hypothetical protein [Hyphomicrobium sulfonivorans]MBI1650898.1 hypothetical protein [Hyphomicrobium sulfonivorans]NSL72719.1 hypothetical protein [Hyphomicrobium sulfonivorans]
MATSPAADPNKHFSEEWIGSAHHPVADSAVADNRERHRTCFDLIDIVACTAETMLRSRHDALILRKSKDANIASAIKTAVFSAPLCEPLIQVTAFKAMMSGPVPDPALKTYIRRLAERSFIFAQTLADSDVAITTCGNDHHLTVVDLRQMGATASTAQTALASVGIALDRNLAPRDHDNPVITSGIRFPTASGTCRTFGTQEYRKIADAILATLNAVRTGTFDANRVEIRDQLRRLTKCSVLPLPC